MTPNQADALRRAWKNAEEGHLFVLRDGDLPMVEYPPPRSDDPDSEPSGPPTALVRLFTELHHGTRYREHVLDLLTCGDVSVSDVQRRLKVDIATLDALFADLFEVQMSLNAARSEVLLGVVLSEFGPGAEEPSTIDTIFHEDTTNHQ